MKDKQLFKKWWFWVIAAFIVFGVIGSFDQKSNNADNSTQNAKTGQVADENVSTLPKLEAAEYKNKEGLLVYKELKGKGYKVEAEFEKDALTEMNGKASAVFEPLDPNKADDRKSVDAFVVGDLVQTGDSLKLTIAHSPTN